MSSITATTTINPAAQSSAAGGGGGGGGGGGPTSSPLLFFVALGFGVVFTNLWIIVGVKYCFRYNQRNRAARAAADGEPIDLANMPRPRRRREKKLMTMDEVNERFPLTKYKQWKASREHEGLPTAGGISTTPNSRANSIKDAEAAIPVREDGASSPKPITTLAVAQEDHAHANASSTIQPQTSNHARIDSTSKSIATEKSPELAKQETATSELDPKRENTSAEDADETDDDDDPIRTATAPEAVADPGDTCAICLDGLEDADDVRGLSCGHAFHASCLDPWLTSRRACCPLCKADYYVPKPRPEGETVEQVSARRSNASATHPNSPPQGMFGLPRNNPFGFARSRATHGQQDTAGAQQSDTATQHRIAVGPLRLPRVFARPSRQDQATAAADATGTPSANPQSSTPPQSRSWNTPGGPIFPRMFNRSRPSADPTQQPTPSELEAGNRS